MYTNLIISAAGMRFLLLHAGQIYSLEAVGGNHRHKFLPHVPCETLDFKNVGVFFTWEHDSASAILDLAFLNLHRVFGAMIPMVRRTGGFGAANSAFKTTWVLTVLFCGVPAATELPFSAAESHSFLTMRVFNVVDRCRFFIEICRCIF